MLSCGGMASRLRAAMIAGIVAAVCVCAIAGSPTAIAARQAAKPPAWPRYNDPYFSLLAPVDAALQKGNQKDALAALDRLQPQIDAAPAAVRGRAALVRGLLLRLTGDAAGALRAATDARTFGAQAPHPNIEFDALILLSNLAQDRGDLAAAAARLADAVPIAERLDDDLARFNVRLDQGRVARARGRGGEAIAPLSEALALAERMKAIRPQMQALISRSAARLGLSDFDAALADAQRAYDLSAAQAPDLRAAAATALAQCLGQIGDLDAGLALYTDAIESYTKANFTIGIALATRQRMDVRASLGDDEGAAADGDAALALFAKAGSQGQEPAVRSRLALITARLGRRDASTAHIQAAAKGLAAMQPRVRAQVEGDLAQAALAQDDFAGATAQYSAVLDQARRLRDLDLEWRALNGLGRASIGLGDPAAAQARFEAAIAVIDTLRRTLPEAGLRADFVAERLGPYDGLITTLVGRSQSPGDAFIARAFETAERARGRALADLLSEARARPADPAVARVRAREVEFGQRLSSLQQAIAAAATDAERRQRLADLERAERDYDAFVVRIRRETPRYAALAYAPGATAAEAARDLAADQAIVSFWTGAERSIAWVVTRSGLRSYALPRRQDLDRDLARWKSVIAGGASDDARRLGASLHNTLFQGVDYARIRHLVIVPDGPLWRAPFAALVSGSGKWLIEETALSVTPSATLLPALAARAPASRQPGLVFGLEQVPDNVRNLKGLYDPRLLPARPLAHAVAEAQAVAQAAAVDARAALFLNDRADEATFKRVTASPVRVLHVASHALLDDRVPRRSALVLAAGGADDGLLQLNEVANLQIDADLVVLSTCQSQLGRTVRGEGLASLSRAFLHSGARGVMASIWAVDDRETARLMPLFYQALRAGDAPDAALRAAQLRMIAAGGNPAAPVNWAGFVVMGRATRPIY